MSKEAGLEQKKPNKIVGFFKTLGRFIKKHLLLFIIIIILIGVGVFFGRKYLAKADNHQEEEQTFTTAVEVMDLQSSVSVTGTLAAGQSQSVTSTVATGTEVSAVYYEVGDYVEAGTVVVEFDADDYATKLAELNAKYNISDKKNAKELQDYLDEIEEYQEEITEIQEWLDEYEIYYLDVKDAYENYQKYPYSDEKARYEEQAAAVKSLYNFTMDDYEDKQDEIEELQEKIEEAQYNYELAQLQQEYDNTYTKSDEYDSVTESQSGTQVVAPFSGYITAINVSEGNNYTQGTTVFTISNTDSFVVEATVDEYDITSLSEGLSAVVKFDATDDDEFTGTLTYVAVTSDSTTSTSSSSSSGSSSASSSSSSSASYEVKITLDDTDDRLRVGMTAKASVILEAVTDAYAVAYDCVTTDADGNSYVIAVDDEGNETQIDVTLGLESDYYVQIISDELTEGMLVKATTSSTSDKSDSSSDMLMNMGGGQGGGNMGGGPGGGGQGGGPGGGF
ncbi:MAG: efflux RND transporter periplasmic adaptor subunit [Pseudobutyrivibrio sp.]|nr:efflux RND transporter periplasmic adaptor subunit [Pseudobutyrivibrio sp.]